jgi:transposase
MEHGAGNTVRASGPLRGELGLGRKGPTTLAGNGRDGGADLPPWASFGLASRSSGAVDPKALGRHAGRVRPSSEGQRAHSRPLARATRATAQKKTLHASERDTPRVQRLRARWRQTRRHLDPKQLIFVDESGLNLALTRLYARAPRGVRAVGSVPQNYGQSLTVLAALDCRGIRAAMIVPGATDREVFVRFLQQVLGPQRPPGAVVVLDNLTAHKGVAVQQAIQKAGAQLYYLPPYSPDYNPIEPAWSKIKTLLRGVGARTRRKLYRSLKTTLAQVSTQDAEAWFAHCGYPLH